MKTIYLSERAVVDVDVAAAASANEERSPLLLWSEDDDELAVES